MVCPKCKGRIVVDRIYTGSREVPNEEPVDMLHCLNCGLLSDWKIIENQKKQLEELRVINKRGRRGVMKGEKRGGWNWRNRR